MTLNEHSENTLTFEQAYSRLEEIARTLERDTVPLQQSFDLYQEGQRLLAVCHKMLDEAEKQITVLQNNAADGLGKEEVIG